MTKIAQLSSALHNKSLSRNLLTDVVGTVPDDHYCITHALGFLRLLLGRTVLGPIYLHFWKNYKNYLQSADLTIHRHAVAIECIVLTGIIQNANYDWIESPEGHQMLFEKRFDGSHGQLSPTLQTGNAIIRDEECLTAGQYYSIPLGQFHRSRALEAPPAMTIVQFLETEKSTAMIVAPREFQARQLSYASEKIDKRQTRALIDQAIAAIAEMDLD